MATQVSICSAALARLGATAISSFSDGSVAASLCSSIYPQAKLAMMRAHPWNCLVTRVQLAPLAEAPVGGDYSAQFNLPGDCLRLLDVFGGLEYSVERKRVLCSTDSLPIRYIADRSEGYWDDSLVEAMTARMAELLAYPITKSASVAQEQARAAAFAIRQAKSIDGQENQAEQLGDSPFIDVRG